MPMLDAAGCMQGITVLPASATAGGGGGGAAGDGGRGQIGSVSILGTCSFTHQELLF